MFDQLRQTSSNKLGGILRILLGFVFFMAGILKVVVPSLGQAFSGQLIAADIPLHGFVLFSFPIVETVLGVLLIFGFHARLSARCRDGFSHRGISCCYKRSYDR